MHGHLTWLMQEDLHGCTKTCIKPLTGSGTEAAWGMHDSLTQQDDNSAKGNRVAKEISCADQETEPELWSAGAGRSVICINCDKHLAVRLSMERQATIAQANQAGSTCLLMPAGNMLLIFSADIFLSICW